MQELDSEKESIFVIKYIYAYRSLKLYPQQNNSKYHRKDYYRKMNKIMTQLSLISKSESSQITKTKYMISEIKEFI